MTKENTKQTPSYPAPVVYRVGRQTVRLGFREVKDMICRGQTHMPTDTEVVAFMMYCRARRADPWIQDSMLIKYAKDKPAAFVDGVGFYLRIAEENPHYRGFKSGIIVRRKQDPEKAKEAVKFAVQQLGQTVETRDVIDLMTKPYEIVHKDGTFIDDGEQLVGAWCQIYRNDRDHLPMWTVNLSEYDQKQAVWNEKKTTMIHKVAISQDHRYCFKQLRGGVTQEELEMLHGDAEIEELPEDSVQRLRNDALTALDQYEFEPEDDLKYDQEAMDRYIDEDLPQAMTTAPSNIYQLLIEKCATKEGARAFLEAFKAHVKEPGEGEGKKEKHKRTDRRKKLEEPPGDAGKEKGSKESKEAPDDSVGMPEVVERWSIAVREAELEDAWRAYKTFAGFTDPKQVDEAIERADGIGFNDVIKRLGNWWLMPIPELHRKSLLKGQPVKLNHEIDEIGRKIFS